MKNRAYRVFVLILIMFVFSAFAACSMRSADDLYTLPKAADEYMDLEREIGLRLAAGAEYSPPSSGSYRQSVQLEDLDGDGVSEALVFLNVSGDTKPLKICIYTEEDGDFSEAAVIEGEGTSFESINYVDMDSDGVKELAIGRQISSSVKMLTVYSTEDFQMPILLQTDYLEYTVCNLSETQGSDLFVIRQGGADQAKEINVLSCMENGEVVTANARLSRGVESVSRLRNSKLSDDMNAVIVEGVLGSGEVFTDIIARSNGVVRNITLNTATGVSEKTVRTNVIYSRDIDRDGIVEIPNPVQMPSQSESNVNWLTEWYAYSSTGGRNLIMTTFNNTTDGWMFTTPREWTDRITVRRTEYISGERSMVFSYIGNNSEMSDFLAIFTLSGENKSERAKLSGRFILATESERIFAARILNEKTAETLGVNTQMVKDSFNIIYSEWNTGET